MSFQPRSSRPLPPWAKPCGRMAGRAAPLRASRPEEREAKGFASVGTCYAPLLTDDAAAEAADRTRTGRGGTRLGARSREHGAAEILFEAVGDIVPKLDHLLGGTATRIDFHDRTAVNHRRGEISAVMDGDRSDGAVLRQRDRGLVGDLGLGSRCVDDEDQRLAGAVAQIDGGADRAK